ncbi:MAG TPA: class I SAM-dependent methyltransferase [Gemmatimonadaceae bacterium]|nr:class I SAM-dependent methyltransferase [Gemmatimonadaceae bacterium]
MTQPDAGNAEDESSRPVARPFYAAGGLNIETYDVRHATMPGSVADDVAWYVRHARAAGGPVLELACGTGRVTWPLARAGVDVVGLDLSPAMLAVAAGKRAAEPPEVAARARFVQGDMADFALGETFALVLVPFRAFQVLPTPEAQRCALACIHRHLRPGGALHLDLFDPLLHLLVPGALHPGLGERASVTHPVSGNVVTIEVRERVNDPVHQLLRERWHFTETGPAGEVLPEEMEELVLRWSYRYEMRHLLELCGFALEAEYSDFTGAPPAYGREQIWVARRDGAAVSTRG